MDKQNAYPVYCGGCADDACVHYQPDLKFRFWLQNFPVGKDFTYHILRYNTIMVLLEGEVELTINDQKHLIHAGEMIVIPLFSVVTTHVLNAVKVIALTLDPNYFQLCLSRYVADSVEHTNFLKEDSHILTCTPEVSDFMSNLIFYLNHISGCGQFHYNKANELGMLFSISYSKEELKGFLRSLFCKESDFVHKINRNLDHFVSVENMAQYMNMSISVFNNTFKAVFQESPYKWLLKQKSRVILQYISVHSCTIKDIINEFNFNSPSHFHRFCLSQYHCPPTELFKKFRQDLK